MGMEAVSGKIKGHTVNSGLTKKLGLLAIFLLMMVGLGYWVTHFGANGLSAPADGPKYATAETLNTSKLAAEWPLILSHAAAPARGNPRSRYTIAEFGDFQCPQCGKARLILEALLKKYPDQVNLVFIHRPFPNIHPWANPAGQASEIAAVQGKFWPMYDVLYAHQTDLEPGYYEGYATTAGLNQGSFQKAFDSGQGADKVKDAAAFSDSLGIQTTPTVLLYDSQKQTVTVYIGLNGTNMLDGAEQYPGIRQLFTQPPWQEISKSPLSPQ